MLNRGMLRVLARCLACGAFATGAAPVLAIEYVFPPGARVVDVTKPPYEADNSGATDVSDILTRALGDDNRDQDGWGCHIVYLPNGTYLVRNTVKWRFPPYTIGPHLVGQSKSGVVVKLAKGTWPEGTERKAVIQTGEGVAQNFNRGLFNVTVLVDSNNAGAYGVYYYGNNQSMMSDVDIVSADGRGVCGLWLGHWQSGGGEQGPCLARRVSISGFRSAVSSNALNDVVLSQIRIQGQSEVGILNDGHPLYIDGLVSRNRVTAVHNLGSMVLVNADLTDGTQPAAVVNERDIFYARAVTTGGYQRALSSSSGNAPSGTAVAEFISKPVASQFPSHAGSLGLPEEYPPEIAWESDMGRWAVVTDYLSGRTHAQALQAAIDDPAKTTVAIPRDLDLFLDDTVYVRGSIRRVIGTGGTVNRSTGSDGTIVLADGVAPELMLEKLGANTELPIVKRTARTVVMECVLAGPVLVEASGKLFYSDGVVPLLVDHPQARVYAWQFDAEGSTDDNLIVRDGCVRIFGWKDEGSGRPLHCLGGATEILGFLQYSNGDNHDGFAMCEVRDAVVTIAGMTQMNWSGNEYQWLVCETRAGIERNLYASANAASGGTAFALYSACPLDWVPPASSIGAGPAQKRLPVSAPARLQPTLDLRGRVLRGSRAAGVCVVHSLSGVRLIVQTGPVSVQR